jgi:hypothetical protein
MTPQPRGSGRLLRRRRRLIVIVGIGVWLTGLVWLMFHYLLVRDGEFGPQTHPLEPWSLALHAAFGFAAIWVFGLLWSAHIARAWPLVRRRWSGVATTALIAWLMASGYLLYYVGNESLRASLSLMHWSLGVACPLVFVVHRYGLRLRRTGGSVEASRSERHPSARKLNSDALAGR